MAEDIPLNETDGWLLRAFLAAYALYAASYIMHGLWIRLRRKGWRQVLIDIWRKYLAFIVLAVVLLDYAGLFAGISVIYEQRGLAEWFKVMALWHTIYAMLETHISFRRLPKQLMSNTELTWVSRAVYVTQIAGGFRLLFGGPLSLSGMTAQRPPLETAVHAINILHAVIFTLMEALFLYKTTHMRHGMLSAEMKHTTKYLWYANAYGVITGIADIASQVQQQQMLEATVLILCATSLTYYGRLLGIANQNSASAQASRRKVGQVGLKTIDTQAVNRGVDLVKTASLRGSAHVLTAATLGASNQSKGVGSSTIASDDVTV